MEATLILEPWNYRNYFGGRSDHGYNFCVYMPRQWLAVYVRSRHRTKCTDLHGPWKPESPGDHFFDGEDKDICGRYTLPVFKTLDGQLSYVKSLLEPQTMWLWPDSGGLQADAHSREEKIFTNPAIKRISLSGPELGLLFKPIQQREGEALFDLLYSYVDKR